MGQCYSADEAIVLDGQHIENKPSLPFDDSAVRARCYKLKLDALPEYHYGIDVDDSTCNTSMSTHKCSNATSLIRGQDDLVDPSCYNDSNNMGPTLTQSTSCCSDSHASIVTTDNNNNNKNTYKNNNTVVSTTISTSGISLGDDDSTSNKNSPKNDSNEDSPTSVAVRTAQIFRRITVNEDGTISSSQNTARASHSSQQQGDQVKRVELCRQAAQIEKATDLVEEEFFSSEKSPDDSDNNKPANVVSLFILTEYNDVSKMILDAKGMPEDALLEIDIEETKNDVADIFENSEMKEDDVVWDDAACTNSGSCEVLWT